MKKAFYITILALLLYSCSSVNYKISSDYSSHSFNDRIRFIILHYTALDDERSLRALTQNNVSAHYLVLKDKRKPILSLVSDYQRSWHAGVSSFAGFKNLNDNSIGIEISNMGYVETDPNEVEHKLIDIAKFNKITDFKNYFYPELKEIPNISSITLLKQGESLPVKKEVPNITLKPELFEPFEKEQILKVGSLLVYLTNKYNINPKYVLGHSDIAPTRKMDPGARFPWKFLYDNFKVGAWFDEKDFDSFYKEEIFSLYTVSDIKKELKKYGYDINTTNEWDWNSKKVVSAFQMHFRPEKIDGVVDLETFAIIKALNKKYK